MRTIYVVICHDIESASIDKDCVFNSKAIAEATCKELSERYTDQNFCVCSIEIEEEDKIARAIEINAVAISEIANAISEFVKCSCSVDGLGIEATNPTIHIN